MFSFVLALIYSLYCIAIVFSPGFNIDFLTNRWETGTSPIWPI